MLDFLSGIYLIPNVNGTVKIRTALMLSQVMKITYPSGFQIQHVDILAKVEKAAIDMVWQQSQSFQIFGVQIAICLCKGKDLMNCMVFNNLARLLKVSKYREVRKIIIKLMKFPTFIREPISEDDKNKEYKLELKNSIIRIVGSRLLDSEPDVRYEAYQKLISLNIKIEDFDCPDTRMIIFKEGMTDVDPKVKNACIQFLTPSIVRQVEVEVNKEDFKSKAKQQKEINTKRRKSNVAYIAKNAQRDS